jgi:predicted nucleic acid-binding Zn ribbon protein
MPVYTYRREDGTTFDYRQKFLDDPLTIDPETGQQVVRVIQPAGVIFKGSGFYVNDSKSASRSAVNSTSKSEKHEADTKSDAKSETKTETKAEAKTESSAASTPSSAAAAD